MNKNEMHNENIEVASSIDKLIEFMHSDEYANLSGLDQGLAMVQLRGMRMYQEALSDRIAQL